MLSRLGSCWELSDPGPMLSLSIHPNTIGANRPNPAGNRPAPT